MTQKNDLLEVARPSMEIQHQEYLTSSKATTLIGCSRQYIYELVAVDELKASHINNRIAFIRRADIEQILRDNPYCCILSDDASTPREPSSSPLPVKKKKREKGGKEMLDFYSGRKVISPFKTKRSWLYTFTGRGHTPICRITGENYCSKRHVDELLGVAVDTSKITDWLLTREVEELFDMKPATPRIYTCRHGIPTKREYGRIYYLKLYLNKLRKTDPVNDECYYTAEQVQRIYDLSPANICHIVKVKHAEKTEVGVKNLLLHSDIERVMTERDK